MPRRAVVPALLMGDFRVFWLELDDRDLAPALLEMDQAFWEGNVLPRVPPDPDDSEATSRTLEQGYLALAARFKGAIIGPVEGFTVELSRQIRNAQEALEAAQEELRLIRMKDTNAVYDPGLRVLMQAAIAKAKGQPT